MAGFVLKSPSFAEGGQIPIKHSCDGRDVSPALVWEDAPAATVALALIVDDPDARGFVHWVAYNIAGGPTGGLPEGAGSASAPPQGRNDFGRVGWGGPCPPGGTHRYRFTLYALSSALTLSGTPSASEVRGAAARVLLGNTTLTATYTRAK
jgi:Raf kinase inhibitor-like YbhB/YbcL family protein